MKRKRKNRLINVLTGVGLIVVILLLLKQAFIGAVVGAILSGLFGQNILLGALAGAVLGGIYFIFFSEGGVLDDESIGYRDNGSGASGPLIGLKATQAVSDIRLSDQEIGQQILIQRPVAEVFRYVANFENYREWKEGIVESRRISEQSEGVGTQFQQRERAVGTSGRSNLEITEWVLNRKIAYRSYTDETNLLAQVTTGFYTFTPATSASRGTTVAHVIRVGTKAGWGLSRQPYQLAIAQDLLQLKQHLEQASQ